MTTETKQNVTNDIQVQNPPSIYQEYILDNIGGYENKFQQNIDVSGYAIVNIVIHLRGKRDKKYFVQIRHFHPQNEPTAMFVLDSKTGKLGAAGSEIVSFKTLRPMLPKLNVLAYSEDEENFEKIEATIYATMA